MLYPMDVERERDSMDIDVDMQKSPIMFLKVWTGLWMTIGRTADSRQQTADSRQQTADSSQRCNTRSKYPKRLIPSHNTVRNS